MVPEIIKVLGNSLGVDRFITTRRQLLENGCSQRKALLWGLESGLFGFIFAGISRYYRDNLEVGQDTGMVHTVAALDTLSLVPIAPIALIADRPEFLIGKLIFNVGVNTIPDVLRSVRDRFNLPPAATGLDY